MSTKYTKSHKNPQGEQVYKIEKEGKAEKYVVLENLKNELAIAKARVHELLEDIEAVSNL